MRRQRKTLKETQSYSLLQSNFYERYKSVFIDLTKPLGWSYTLFTKDILDLQEKKRI